MKVLVTGGAGFIGSAYIRNMIRTTDFQVLNVDALTYAATPEALEDTAQSNRYAFAQVDIRDRKSVEDVVLGFAPDAIVHLAAESHVDRSIDGPGVFVETNILGTFNMLQAALNRFQNLKGPEADRFRFHHVSTDEVYGTLGLNDPAFTETTRYSPNSPYSSSKAGSDHLVRAWGETYGLPILVTNCSNNYGPWQYPEKLIPLMLSKGMKSEPMPVYGSGENIRDWLYVEDHARALLRVLEAGKLGETYNIGGCVERQNIQIVSAICDYLDKVNGGNHADLISYVSDRPGHDFRYGIDASKIDADLGWKPSETFESGLEKTLAWYFDNQDWLLGGAQAATERRGLKKGAA